MQRFIALAFSTLLLLSLNAATPETHYTVIVSLDGFRWDYPDMYKTPNLDRMAADGVKAVMLPSYPASTFPNHYTLATGLVPDHHGIINNTFWDVKNRRQYSMGDSATRNNPEYYLGEPIWITAQKQGVKTGNMYWVGSDIAIKKSHPTYYRPWNAKPFLTFEQRIDTVLTWLQKPEPERPRLIMLYFEEPDGSGHHNGPCSLPTGAVVQHIDSLVGVLRKKIEALPFGKDINLIVTSDHGTIQVDRPVRVQGDRETSSNLRYKTGRNLGFNPKEVFAITKPEQAHLPKSNITSTYIFAYNRDFFVYPNDTNRFVRYYNDTFQHGGISMEEMIIPFIVMKPR